MFLKNNLDEYHKLYVTIFIEQIIPFLEKNPGYLQANLKKTFPNIIKDDDNFHSEMKQFIYYLSRENLIERRKNGRTYELFLKCTVDRINNFLSPDAAEWNKRIAYKPSELADYYIDCEIYHNSEQMIVNYFGKNIVNIFYRYNIDQYLLNIGSSLKFEMNDALKHIIEKYWTNECEKELRNYLLIFGFFADDTFTRIKFKSIIGEKKHQELLNELEQNAAKFKILWCGWETMKPQHIPSNFIRSLKFKWGLKPEIIEKNCEYCNENFIPIYHLRTIIDNEIFSSIKSLNEFDFCHRHALGKNLKMDYKPPHREGDRPDKASEVILNTAYPNGSKFEWYRNQNRPSITKDRMIQLIKDLINLIGFIPPSNFKTELTYLNYLDKKLFNKAIKLLNDMPYYETSLPSSPLSYHSPMKSYKEVFGSWFKVLIAAGVLENDAQKMNFGYRCLANDGHECNSLAEKSIDDWLHLNNIPHEKEPAYPTGFFRGDWKVDKIFIEYWGLRGNEDYDNKIFIKREVLKDYNIPLIEIGLNDLPNLDMKLKVLRNYCIDNSK